MLSDEKCVDTMTGHIVIKILLILARHLLHLIMPIMPERPHVSYSRDFSYINANEPGRIMIFQAFIS